MDKYGIHEITKEDALKIRKKLDNQGSVVFSLSGDGLGAMIILLCGDFDVAGSMPFGGQPHGRVYVGIQGRGCFHFERGDELHSAYIMERLGLSQRDADTFAIFWDLMWS